MSKQSRYSPEVRERTVRMVLGHQQDYASQWQAVVLIAAKFGCTAESLRRWVRQAEVDSGRRGSQNMDDRSRIKELERENLELRRTNEILRKASAFFRAGGARGASRRLRISPLMPNHESRMRGLHSSHLWCVPSERDDFRVYRMLALHRSFAGCVRWGTGFGLAGHKPVRRGCLLYCARSGTTVLL
jgi:transposase